MGQVCGGWVPRLHVVEVVCIKFAFASQTPLCVAYTAPLFFLSVPLHSQHSPTYIEGKVVGMQVVHRVLRIHTPSEEALLE